MRSHIPMVIGIDSNDDQTLVVGDPAILLDVRVRTDDSGRTADVHVAGPICAFTADYFERRLGLMASHGAHEMRIDASQVTVLTSDGLDVLERIDLMLRQNDGGRLTLTGASMIVRRVLSVTGATVRVAGR